MLKRLAEGGWIDYEPGCGARLTAAGITEARRVIRRHRLAECLFANALHVENAEVVAQQACKFEHVLSPEVTDRICTFLGHPATCPHGSQIPRGPCCPQQ